MSPDSHPGGDPDGPMRAEYQYGSDTPPSTAIVQAIAVIEDVDPKEFPTDLDVRLYDHIDPTALDRLVTRDQGSDTVSVTFTIQTENRYTVEIQDTGQLTVEKNGESTGTR